MDSIVANVSLNVSRRLVNVDQTPCTELFGSLLCLAIDHCSPASSRHVALLRDEPDDLNLDGIVTETQGELNDVNVGRVGSLFDVPHGDVSPAQCEIETATTVESDGSELHTVARTLVNGFARVRAHLEACLARSFEAIGPIDTLGNVNTCEQSEISRVSLRGSSALGSECRHCVLLSRQLLYAL